MESEGTSEYFELGNSVHHRLSHMIQRFIFVPLLAVGVILPSSAAFSPSSVPHGQISRPGAEAVLAAAMIQPDPVRNLYTLTEQLRLHPPRPFNHVIRSFTPNYAVGRQDTFWVLAEDTNHYFRMHATIRAKTKHFYLYVQNGIQANAGAVQRAATTFETKIYPTDRSFFGSEWAPGVDHDPRITCLIGDLKSSGVGGYFSAEDEYPVLVNRYSNQREMFYINSGQGTIPADASFDLTLAHEFQHMIHWHMHPHENLWLNEGMSMLAESLNHYPVDAEPGSFVSSPTTQLDTWSLSGDNLPHYGAAYLFLSYLYDRFGRGLVRGILADKTRTDFQLIDEVLHKLHIRSTADSLFSQWVIANYVNDSSVAGGLYGYRQLPTQVTATKTLAVPFAYQGQVPPYAAQYLMMDGLQGHKPFRLDFSAKSRVPAVGVTSSTPFWWSMRGDMIDTRLTRQVDLRNVRHATLHFATWYDIEKNYDYGYVEASLDGGKSWTTLPGTHTTRQNPNGANYGDGYTGQSKRWLSEQVDLSRYAGHTIQVRFQYITDEGVNGNGFVVRNLSIPEIGVRDMVTGWKPDGFVPVMSNLLVSKWMVQTISYTHHGIVVGRMHVTGGKGSLTMDPNTLDAYKVVVVVYTSAPKTTVQSPFTLSAQPVSTTP